MSGAATPLRDELGCLRSLAVGSAQYAYYSLPALADRLGADLDRLPFSLRVLLENLLRHTGDGTVSQADVAALARWDAPDREGGEVAFHPARVLMPDSSGIPLLIDFAALRDAVAARGLDPRRVNPRIPVDLVIDHSVRTDFAGTPDAFTRNLAREMERNGERYAVVRWAMEQYDNLRVIPPANGIVHQINIEYLASVVTTIRHGDTLLAFPDSLVGMDSHTPMVNALGVFGWGVGGIEAASALVGQPVALLVPRIVGCRVSGTRRTGVMCTDIVLSLTRVLRAAGVLGAVVEFFGPGLDELSLPDRATIANMAAEYGATMGFFPVDHETVRYLAGTGRSDSQVALVEAYARAQRLWREKDGAVPGFAQIVDFDLGTVQPSLAGPTRPEHLVPLPDVPASFRRGFADRVGAAPAPPVADTARALRHGDIVIASIASCTNTSNPFQIVAAGLLARNAAARGLTAKPWVKTSFSPGSRVVTALLDAAGLTAGLEAIGFYLAGYGCMSCGGGSGPLSEPIAAQIEQDGLIVLGMLSSNRNFEGRLHPLIRGTYLGSPPLVVAYAIAGSALHDLAQEPLGVDRDGVPVLLSDIWPQDAEIDAVLRAVQTPAMFRRSYGALADGGPGWTGLAHADGPVFAWDPASLYIKRPPFLDAAGAPFGDIRGARALLLLGDDITTDHISPGGAIPPASPAGAYLQSHGITPAGFSTYVARRANHEVMVRGTFANIRLRNELAPGTEGGMTRHMPDGETTTVFAAAERYRAEDVPLVVIAGANYGCGSSRDWAAKGTALLGIRAVLAESFERIHRSNLVGMGVVPLQFTAGVTRHTLGLDGSETIDLLGFAAGLAPGMRVRARFTRRDGSTREAELLCRIDTRREAEWVRQGGILPYVLHEMTTAAAAPVATS